MPSNLTRADLVAWVAEETGLPRSKTDTIIQSLLKHLKSSLVEGKSVRLVGFGSFQLQRRAPRRLRSPQTGEWIEVPEKTIPVFRPGQDLCRQVNHGKNQTQRKRLLHRLKEKLLGG